MTRRTSVPCFVALLVLLPLSSKSIAEESDESQVSPALVAARQHYFGPENVDPGTGAVRTDRVIVTWFSNASFAVAFSGRVVLWDAYINQRHDVPGRTPTTLQELVDLNPEMIFIGHGHGDHAPLAGYIAAKTGATVIGTPEHCDQVTANAKAILGPSATVKCLAAVSRGSAPGAEINELSVLKPQACVTVFKHVHSGFEPPDPTLPPNPVNPIVDNREPLLYPPLPPPSDGVTIGGPENGSLFYQFIVNDGKHNLSLVYNDTVGPKETSAQIFEILRGLPKTDFQFGSVVSAGFRTNGVRDPVLYIQNLQPRIFVGIHLTDFTQPSTSPFWKQAVERQFDIVQLPQKLRPQLRWITDPVDYLRPEIFTLDPKNDYWSTPGPGNRTNGRCGGDDHN